MRIISLFRRAEGETIVRAHISIFLDKMPPTRLGFGLLFVLPWPVKDMQDVFSGRILSHAPVFGFVFRWRDKHISGRRTFLGLRYWWIPKEQV